jgi:hypothetical protein
MLINRIAVFLLRSHPHYIEKKQLKFITDGGEGMFKKSLMFLLGFIVTLAGYSTAWSSVAGTWDIQGPMTAKVTAKGMKSKTIKSTMDDVWIFHDDGAFESQNVGGTWTELKKKFTVYPDPADISDVFAAMLSEELETDITVEQVTKMTCSGTEQKNGTIKGSLKVYLNIYSSEYNIHGKATISSAFIGTRQAETFIAKSKTIIIDGNYDDWDISDRVYKDTDGKTECSKNKGRDIQEVYVAQDNEFIYFRFILSAPFDLTSGYRLGGNPHIYVGYNVSKMIMFFSTGATNYPPLPDSYLYTSSNQFEAKFPKNQVGSWKGTDLAAWSGAQQGSCTDFIELPEMDLGL